MALWAGMPYRAIQAMISRAPYIRRYSWEMARAFSFVMPLIWQSCSGSSAMTVSTRSPKARTSLRAVAGPMKGSAPLAR